uniref:Cytochrome b6-f complex subunit PetP n=1 Tax=Acrosorium ciliolatum TaxID=1550622 RepID=A0A1Z1M1R8_9FLOR|nr:cytochrome b6-f complex subunit PetP [Acrosorium ciliolatum]ARW60027.1 cytochrome b6-f complex subunit PetP [Acrosorium ciliolatum]
MNKYSVNINIIPMKTKLQIMNYVNQKSWIVGYKRINSTYRAPIIEFKDFTRVWMLNNEITLNFK